ncbi:MAG TPA: hypothetical protein VMR25_05765 [Planctomycetaceae bacterium]|nr:hypothetical protein [Planctomycetaceae bacterium]
MRPLLLGAVLAGLFWALNPVALNPAVGADQPSGKSIPPLSQTTRESWKYVAEPPKGETVRPLFRTVRLSKVPPPGIRETVSYRGRSRLYGEIRFGSENSEPVLLVVDTVDASDCDLYVDANRNRSIEPKDKVGQVATRQSAGKTKAAQAAWEWVLPLSAQIVQREAATLVPRTVLIRRRKSSDAVSIATVGYSAGTVELSGRRVKARRIDGDANGLFSDPGDRLRIDVNGDGAWDDLSEQFPLTPSIQIAGRRYAVRGDRLGLQLRLELVEWQGYVRLQPGGLAPATRIRQITCMLVGEDGIGFTLAGSERLAVPIGRYSIDTLSLTLADANGRTWSYLFSRDPGSTAQRTVLVEKDREIAVDPVGRMQLRFENEYKVTQAQAGQTLCYRPLLVTASGLNTNFCRLADDKSDRATDEATTAHFRLQSLAGQVFDRAESHYACGALCDFAVTVPSAIRAREIKLEGDVDLGPVAGKVTAASLIPIKANYP